jgi:iron complex outermembrane receptor protein
VLALQTACLFALTASMPGAVVAAENESSAVLEEIMVTAERREASLQSVPISIAALSGDQLDASVVSSTMDLQYRIPSYVYKTNTAFGQPFIRGVGSDLLSSSADSSVAIFVDDVYQSRATAALQDFYDLDRVEVVKGPQSTLFGRNVTGGSIRLFSKRPQPEFGLEGDLLFGNYDRKRIRGAINAPLVGDTLIVRFAGLKTERDGYVTNLLNGRKVDDEDLWSGRLSVAWKASDAVDVLFIGDYTKEDSSRALGQKADDTCCVNLGIAFGGTVPDDPRKIYNDTNSSLELTSKGVSTHVTWDLGNYRLKSITAWRKSDLEEILDLDATEIPMVINSPFEHSKTFSQELELASKSDSALQWVAGLLYLNERTESALNIQLPLFLASSVPGAEAETDAYSAFFDAGYQLNPAWKVSAGVRYSHEKRAVDFQQVISDPLGAVTGVPGTVVLANQDSKSWNSWTPRVGVEFKPTEDVLLYFSASKGFKAGGFNTTALQSAFDPESLKAYEIGVKSTLAERRVRLNAAAFYYDYTNIQLLTLDLSAPVGAFPIIANAGKAKVKGLEIETAADVAGGLGIDASLTFLDAEYTEFDSVDPNRPTEDTNRAGQRMPQAPRFSGALGAQYRWTVAGGEGQVTARSEYRYQSEVYFNSFADPNVKQDGYGLLNLRLAYESVPKKWYVAAYCKNVTDKLYAQTIIRQDPLVGNLLFWGAPRTYGLEIGAKY